jgi:hypothetical protein
VLQDRDLRYNIAIVGGSALLLTGEGSRATQDADVVALATGDAELRPTWRLPADLESAVLDVAATLGLRSDWLYAGAGALVGHRLPGGYERRLRTRSFGGLVVSVLRRPDLIALKLLAAVDEGPTSRHMWDLRTLEPTRRELERAFRWLLQTHSADDPLVHDLARAFDMELPP